MQKRTLKRQHNIDEYKNNDEKDNKSDDQKFKNRKNQTFILSISNFDSKFKNHQNSRCISKRRQNDDFDDKKNICYKCYKSEH